MQIFDQIRNSQILGFIPLSQILGFIPLLQIYKFLQNTAQLCLKAVLKVIFLKSFFYFVKIWIKFEMFAD